MLAPQSRDHVHKKNKEVEHIRTLHTIPPKSHTQPSNRETDLDNTTEVAYATFKRNITILTDLP